VGQAVSGLGQEGQVASQGLFRAAIERQDLYNQVSAHDASFKTQDEWNKVLFGDPSDPTHKGLYSMQGEEGMRGAQDARTKVMQIYDQHKRGLNSFAGIEYDNETRRLLSFTLNDIGRHYDQEFNRWQTQTNKAKLDLATQGLTAGASVNDPAKFDLYANDIIKAEVRLADPSGSAGPDIVNDAINRGRATAVTAWATEIGDKNPAEAIAFLDKEGDILPANHRHTLLTEFKSKALNQQATSMVFGSAPSNDYASKVTQFEGTGRDPRSSAVGGFINSTWLDLMHGEPEAQGKDPDAILALRSDPVVRTRMTNKYAEQNTPILQAAGVPVNSGSLQLAHFLGPQNAIIVLSMPPNTPVTDALSKPVIDSNKSVLAGKTTGQIVADATARMGTDAGSPSQQNQAGQLKDLLAQTTDPELQQKLVAKMEEKYRLENMERLEHQRKLTEANDTAALRYTRQISAGNIDKSALVDQISKDPDLKWQTMLELKRAALSDDKNASDKETSLYGPGYWDIFTRAVAPTAATTNRITDPNEILRFAGSPSELAAGGPGGWLNTKGAEKIMELMHNKTPEGQAGNAQLHVMLE
jgi:hypothetical protein